MMRVSTMAAGLVFGVCAAGGWAEAFSVSYDQTVTQGRQVVHGTVSLKDDLFRLEMTMDGQATVTIRNASGTFMYLPQEGVAMKLSALDPSQQPIQHVDDYQQYLQERQAQRIGAETIDGHPCEIYQFTDPETQGPVTAWVWTEKQFPIKMEIGEGSKKMLVEIRNVQFGAALPDTAFQLPADAQVMDMGGMLPMGR